MKKPAFIAGQPATIDRRDYLILCIEQNVIPKDSTSNKMLCCIDRVWNTYDGEPVYDISFNDTTDPLNQQKQILHGVYESTLGTIVAVYPTSKFKVGDHVKISIDHYSKIYTPTFAPEISKRVGIITSILYNAITPTGKCTNKYKIKLDYFGCESHFSVAEEDLELWDIHYDTQKNEMNSNVLHIPEIDRDIFNYPYTFNEDMYNKALEAIRKYTDSKSKGEEKVKNENALIPEIDRVIFNDPATIILWKSWHMEQQEYIDKVTGAPCRKYIKVQDKTIVKCAHGEEFNKYNGFCAAVAKYFFGTNSNICRIIKNAQDDSGKTIPGEKIVKRDENGKAVSGRYPYGDKKTCECKYYNNKCGRKHTCKQTYDCDGVEDKSCKEYKKNEKKKSKGSERK